MEEGADQPSHNPSISEKYGRTRGSLWLPPLLSALSAPGDIPGHKVSYLCKSDSLGLKSKPFHLLVLSRVHCRKKVEPEALGRATLMIRPVLCLLGVLALSWAPDSQWKIASAGNQALFPKMEDRNRLGLRSRKMNRQRKWSWIPSPGEYWKPFLIRHSYSESILKTDMQTCP